MGKIGKRNRDHHLYTNQRFIEVMRVRMKERMRNRIKKGKGRMGRENDREMGWKVKE